MSLSYAASAGVGEAQLREHGGWGSTCVGIPGCGGLGILNEEHRASHLHASGVQRDGLHIL